MPKRSTRYSQRSKNFRKSKDSKNSITSESSRNVSVEVVTDQSIKELFEVEEDEKSVQNEADKENAKTENSPIATKSSEISTSNRISYKSPPKHQSNSGLPHSLSLEVPQESSEYFTPKLLTTKHVVALLNIRLFRHKFAFLKESDLNKKLASQCFKKDWEKYRKKKMAKLEELKSKEASEKDKAKGKRKQKRQKSVNSGEEKAIRRSSRQNKQKRDEDYEYDIDKAEKIMEKEAKKRKGNDPLAGEFSEHDDYLEPEGNNKPRYKGKGAKTQNSESEVIDTPRKRKHTNYEEKSDDVDEEQFEKIVKKVTKSKKGKTKYDVEEKKVLFKCLILLESMAKKIEDYENFDDFKQIFKDYTKDLLSLDFVSKYEFERLLTKTITSLARAKSATDATTKDKCDALVKYFDYLIKEIPEGNFDKSIAMNRQKNKEKNELDKKKKRVEKEENKREKKLEMKLKELQEEFENMKRITQV
jgi:hypothetical protein